MKKYEGTIQSLPTHTKKETIFGKAIDLKRNKSQGFTVSSDLLPPKPYGYMVAIPNEINITELSGMDIRGKVNQLFQEAIGKADLFIGGYRYTEGKAVLELSEWIPSKDTAIHAAKLREQYSIWDLEAKEEIIILK
jgi:hypothetical protein